MLITATGVVVREPVGETPPVDPVPPTEGGSTVVNPVSDVMSLFAPAAAAPRLLRACAGLLAPVPPSSTLRTGGDTCANEGPAASASAAARIRSRRFIGRSPHILSG